MENGPTHGAKRDGSVLRYPSLYDELFRGKGYMY
jgi:hypothetical protein